MNDHKAFILRSRSLNKTCNPDTHAYNQLYYNRLVNKTAVNMTLLYVTLAISFTRSSFLFKFQCDYHVWFIPFFFGVMDEIILLGLNG